MGRFQGNYQGRGRSSRGGRSGRGQGRNNRNSNKKTNSREIKFAPHASHTRGGYATFDTVLKSVITKVSESVTEYSQDILKSLETMNYVVAVVASFATSLVQAVRPHHTPYPGRAT